jgi:hypothetical protein
MAELDTAQLQSILFLRYRLYATEDAYRTSPFQLEIDIDMFLVIIV